MWSLFEDEKSLEPLVFSNGKSQKDVVKEVLDAVGNGHKIIFIRGMCGTGKSAIALNLARKLGRASIIVPIKSLQEQYSKDYSGKKYIMKDGKKLKIQSIVGRKNFKCRYLQENPQETLIKKEKNAKLSDIFAGKKELSSNDKTCDNIFLPCKIEIKEKNLGKIKNYIKKNPSLNLTNFESVSDVKRMSIAPICPYWSLIISEDYEIKKFKDARKIKYSGLGKEFVIYQRKKGCGFYDQYEAYSDADVLIFNSMKYKLETLMDRKPATDVEIIDECDDFLDSFANKERININRLLFSLNTIFSEDDESEKILKELIDITNTLKRKFEKPDSEILNIKGTLIEKLLIKILENKEFLNKIETDESNYIYHLEEVAKIFHDFLDETYFSIEKNENDFIIHLVTTNLAKKFHELAEKNKILILMSGTIHSEKVLKNIFGIENFKVIEAETKHQGELIKCKHGYEMDCKYSNFQNNKISREEYLKALSKSIASAKQPILIHVNSFSDLPTDLEREKFDLHNLITRDELIEQQSKDPFGERIKDFKNKKTSILFTTKCNRGADFPGDVCNSIIVTKFPYPNISGIFWKILRKTRPEHYHSFYMDKAKRELLQKIYRGLRSKDDKVYLLSPDSRVLDFNID